MIAIDTHTHTVASGHFTTDTVRDLALAASAAGLQALAITDHGPAIMNSAKAGYFRSLLLGTRERYGVKLFFGAEVNVMDASGRVDLDAETMVKLDFCIASLHVPCCKPAGIAENTSALTNAMKHPSVSIIGHPNDAKYPLDLEELVSCAARERVMLELNDTSLTPGNYRGDVRAEAKEMLRLCAKYGVSVSLGSDSHGRARVGDVSHCEVLLAEVNFPDELVANRTLEGFRSRLKKA